MGSDESQQLLGQILANQAEHQRKTDALFAKLDKVGEEVIEHRGVLKVLGRSFEEMTIATKATCAEIRLGAEETQHELEKHKAACAADKNQTKGAFKVIAAVGGMGGLIGFLSGIYHFFAGGGPHVGP